VADAPEAPELPLAMLPDEPVCDAPEEPEPPPLAVEPEGPPTDAGGDEHPTSASGKEQKAIPKAVFRMGADSTPPVAALKPGVAPARRVQCDKRVPFRT
jgi:hypothetical protein